MQMFKHVAAATLCAALAISLGADAVHAQGYNPSGTTATITTGNNYSDNTFAGTAYENDGTLTVTSSSPGSPGATITETGTEATGLYNFLGTTTISGGTIMATGDGSQGVATLLGTTTISGGTVTDSGNVSTSDMTPATAVSNIGTTAISGGTISATGTGGIGVFNDSQASISGGTISGKAADVETFGGTVTITGGTFGTNAADSLVVQDGSIIDIYGTSFTSNGLTGGFGILTSGDGTFAWTQNGVTQTLSYAIDQAGSGGSEIVFLQATPEPSAWLALGLGALGLSGLAFRARKRSGAAGA